MRTWLNTNDSTFLKIREIVNKYDVADLLNDCPQDEYDAEVADILNRCNFLTKIHEIYNELDDIFYHWFIDAYNDKNLKSMAEEILVVFNSTN